MGGQMWTYGSKAKVMKSRWPGSQTPWLVTNHQCGNRSFPTWKEAMWYANSRPVMMNGVLVGA